MFSRGVWQRKGRAAAAKALISRDKDTHTHSGVLNPGTYEHISVSGIDVITNDGWCVCVCVANPHYTTSVQTVCQCHV